MLHVRADLTNPCMRHTGYHFLSRGKQFELPVLQAQYMVQSYTLQRIGPDSRACSIRIGHEAPYRDMQTPNGVVGFSGEIGFLRGF